LHRYPAQAGLQTAPSGASGALDPEGRCAPGRPMPPFSART